MTRMSPTNRRTTLAVIGKFASKLHVAAAINCWYSIKSQLVLLHTHGAHRNRPSPNSAIPSYLALILCTLCATFQCTGCAWISPKDSAFTAYEKAREEINSPTDLEDYRPEGVSAEKKGLTNDFLQRMGWRSTRRKDMELAQNLFAAGEAKFNEAKSTDGKSRHELFQEAAKLYEESAENWQSSHIEQDALMMAAESQFFAENYHQAELLYEQLVKEYPRTPYLDHVDSRRFEIADYWIKTHHVDNRPFFMVNLTDGKYPWNDTGGHGRRILERLRIDNPTGQISDDATMRLAVEQLQAEDYDAAADTFAELRMTYPDSEHLFNAEMLEIESLLASYQGPKYSSVPLTDAQKRVQQIVKQFPSESREKQKELNEAYARIRLSMAERIWDVAEYRRLGKLYGAAKFHYQRILDDYADTPYAEQAQVKISELSDYPDRPAHWLDPLGKLFGSTDDRPWREKNPGAYD